MLICEYTIFAEDMVQWLFICVASHVNEGGIVNVEVRRQEGSSVDQTGSFGSRESSPRNVVFARTPPLPLDTRFRGFGGIAVHGTDTGPELHAFS